MALVHIRYNFGLISDADVQIIGGYIQKEKKRALKAVANLTEKLAGYEAEIANGAKVQKLVDETKGAIQLQTERLDKVNRILNIVSE